MSNPFALEVLTRDEVSPPLRKEIEAFCSYAFEEDLEELFETMDPAMYVVGRVDGAIVSHALWVARRLQAGSGPPLRTAYVEMVATAPEHRGRGWGSAVMRRLVEAIPDSVEFAALCPATEEFYARLGWRRWEGPLAIRMPDGTLLDTPDETVMTYPLPGRIHPDPTTRLTAEWREGELW